MNQGSQVQERPSPHNVVGLPLHHRFRLSNRPNARTTKTGGDQANRGGAPQAPCSPIDVTCGETPELQHKGKREGEEGYGSPFGLGHLQGPGHQGAFVQNRHHVTVLGVRQYLMSSPRFRFRRRRRWKKPSGRRNVAPTPRNRCLAAIVLSSMLLYRAMSMSRSAMRRHKCVLRLNKSFQPEQSNNTCPVVASARSKSRRGY